MNRLKTLHDAGVSIWLDTLSRDLLESGAFAALVDQDAVTGATSNPTIFATAITAALAYINQHGGGTLAVSSQNGGAATSIIQSGADVVAIGGFSGRESQVTAAWLADRVESGAIRWVLTTGGGGPGNDSRVGATDVMGKVASTCRSVSSVSGLYDCTGNAPALRS